MDFFPDRNDSIFVLFKKTYEIYFQKYETNLLFLFYFHSFLIKTLIISDFANRNK